jgi:5-formyltetrahydrofolate cyclo-ligase
MLSLRSYASCEYKTKASFAACENIKLFFAKRLNGAVVALYSPIRNEIDPTPLTAMLLNCRFCLPNVINKHGLMNFVMDQSVVVPKVIITPLVAFDCNLNRLGYGGGYYDRYFANRAADVLKIGIAFSFQLHQGSISTLPHDIKLDCVITENAIFTA